MKVRYEGLLREGARAGKKRWRVRVEGDKRKRITIPVGPDHEAFLQYYHAARAGLQFPPEEELKKAVRGTLQALCDQYLEWAERQVEAGNLSKATLRSRRTGLEQACECPTPNGRLRMGDIRADMDRRAFAHIRDPFGTRTGAADTCLKALRAAYKWGEDYGYPINSDVHAVRSGHKSKGGADPWSDEDAIAFLEAHGPGTMARRWFLLAWNTSGRIGDMHWLGPDQIAVKGEKVMIRYQPSKAGSQLVQVPLSRELATELEHVPEGTSTFLQTELNAPFASKGSLDNRVRKWIIAAGLVDQQGRATHSQHGIRKFRAELIAEHTGSLFAVMSMLSHSEPKTAAIYTDRVERRRIVEKAFEDSPEVSNVPRSEFRGTLTGENAIKTTRLAPPMAARRGIEPLFPG